jgi:hypothetical protein
VVLRRGPSPQIRSGQSATELQSASAPVFCIWLLDSSTRRWKEGCTCYRSGRSLADSSRKTNELLDALATAQS